MISTSTPSTLIVVACLAFLLGAGVGYGFLALKFKHLRKEEAVRQRQHERCTLPLDETQYILLDVCLDELIYETSDDPRTTSLVSVMKEILNCLSHAVFESLPGDQSMAFLQCAEAQRHYFTVCYALFRQRREGRIRSGVYEKVAASYYDIAKEIEECSKTNDWERAREAVTEGGKSAERGVLLSKVPIL